MTRRRTSQMKRDEDEDFEEDTSTDDEPDVTPTKRRRQFKALRIESDDEETTIRIKQEVIPVISLVESDSDSDYGYGEGSGGNPASPEQAEAPSSSDSESSMSSGKEDDDRSSVYADTDSDSFVDTADDEDIDDDQIEHMDDYEALDPGLYMSQNEPRKRNRKAKGRKKSTNARARRDSVSSFTGVEKENVQAVSIHRVMMSKFTGYKTELQVIKRIIEKYNHPSKKRDAIYAYEERPIISQPKLNKKDAQIFHGKQFDIKIYTQKVTKVSSILRSYGVEEDEVNLVHSLIFHYRKDEIFVLTTGHAWNVVQWCSDYEFPDKIAARILSEKGELESTEKSLVGTGLMNKTTHKKEQESNPYEMLTFCTSFTAELRDKCSLLKLSCFHKKVPAQGSCMAIPEANDGEDEDEAETGKIIDVSNTSYSIIKGIKVTVSLASIRIKKRFQPADFLGILDIMSRIAEGKETQDIAGNDEKDCTAHIKYLTPVQTESRQVLNKALCKIIHDALSDDNKMDILGNYEICHKHFQDFFNGCEFRLTFNGESVRTWDDRPPTCRQVIEALKSSNLGKLRADQGEEVFYKQLEKVKLSYQIRDQHQSATKAPEKLLNFIEGMMYRPADNCVYWHIQSHWCYVREDYLLLAHMQFLDILKTSMPVADYHSGNLKLPWPATQEAEDSSLEDIGKKYLQLYRKHEEIYISDQDLFDMMKLTETNTLCVYYLMPGLNFETVSKGIKLTNGLLKIRKAGMVKEGNRKSVGGTDINLKQLRCLYQDVIETKKIFKKAFPTFSNFQEKILQAEVFLLVGPALNTDRVGNVHRTLLEESKIETTITVEDISIILEKEMRNNSVGKPNCLVNLAAILKQPIHKHKCQKLAECLHVLLKSQGYLEGSNDDITGKVLGQNKYTFELPSFGPSLNQFVFEKVIKPFQPQCSTFLAKLEFVRMQRELQKLGFKKFNIIEIPKE